MLWDGAPAPSATTGKDFKSRLTEARLEKGLRLNQGRRSLVTQVWNNRSETALSVRQMKMGGISTS